MSDSNESADVTGPDSQPETPEQNNPPQADIDSPAQAPEEVPPTQPDSEQHPASEATETTPPPAVEAERPDTPSPAADAPETDAAPAEEDASTPPTDEPDTPSPAADAPETDATPAEEDASTPPTDEPDTPSPAADAPETDATPAEEDASTPPTDEPDTPSPAADAPETDATPAEEDTSTPPADEPKAQKAQNTQKPPAGKPGGPKSSGQSKSGKQGGGRQSQGRDRSAGPSTPRRRPGKPPKGPSVVVKYGIMGHIGQFRHTLQPPPPRGLNVVIRTERGVELGEVLTKVDENAEAGCGGCISPKRLQDHITANGPDYPFRRDGKILRLANPQDLIDQRHLSSSATDERKFCAKEIKDMKLDMKLVAVEHLLGGERIIFYFLAEHRVDFRDLVHKLANQYHTRIEMRQVGARDEARLVGDYERCGQECCCKQFLKGLQPVSMRMAKTQKATLDPSKISGRCGRLMCCLRYEDQCYRDLKKCLPHKNIWVKTADQIGRVTGTQILTQLVLVQLPDGTRGVFANEDIIERNVDAPQAPPTPAPRQSRPPRRPERGRKTQSEPAADKQRAKPNAEQKSSRPPRKPKTQQPTKKSEPKPDPKPRATAEALDPGWGALLGDGAVENESQPTPQAPQTQENPIPPTSEETKESPATSATPQAQGQTPADAGGANPPQTGDKPRKRRRRRGRGRRSKGKSQGS
jgi:cell fate regulator YaaT (PSP1 superfamily)